MNNIEDLTNIVRNLQITVAELDLKVNGGTELQVQTREQEHNRQLLAALTDVKMTLRSVINTLLVHTENITTLSESSETSSVLLKHFDSRIDRLETLLMAGQNPTSLPIKKIELPIPPDDEPEYPAALADIREHFEG